MLKVERGGGRKKERKKERERQSYGKVTARQYER
jgi:hypothetical protein